MMKMQSHRSLSHPSIDAVRSFSAATATGTTDAGVWPGPGDAQLAMDGCRVVLTCRGTTGRTSLYKKHVVIMSLHMSRFSSRRVVVVLCLCTTCCMSLYMMLYVLY